MAHSESNSSRSRSPRGHKQAENHKEEQNPCLYIGNIDKRVTQEKLKAEFEKFGEMEYCFIVYEPYSDLNRARGDGQSQSRGYGFAKFKSPEDAQKSRQKMQGFDFNGRKINVEFSKRDNPREKTPGRYLGKKRASPVRRTHRRSYSRSRSRSRSSSQRRKRHYHDKRKRHQRQRSYSRSKSYRRHRSRSSYSRNSRR